MNKGATGYVEVLDDAVAMLLRIEVSSDLVLLSWKYFRGTRREDIARPMLLELSSPVSCWKVSQKVAQVVILLEPMLSPKTLFTKSVSGFIDSTAWSWLSCVVANDNLVYMFVTIDGSRNPPQPSLAHLSALSTRIVNNLLIF